MPSLSDVSPGGDRLVTLQVLRDRLALELDACDSMRDIAALSKQFTDVLAQIDALAGGVLRSEEDSVLDELARRRSGRGAVASGGERS